MKFFFNFQSSIFYKVVKFDDNFQVFFWPHLPQSNITYPNFRKMIFDHLNTPIDEFLTQNFFGLTYPNLPQSNPIL